MTDISFNIACKELKIAQIEQLNQLFQLLHLVNIYGHGFYELPVNHMLMRTNVDNAVSKDSPIAVLNTGFITPWLYFTQSYHHFFTLLGDGRLPGGGGGRWGEGLPYESDGDGMLVVLLMDVNFRFWSHLACRNSLYLPIHVSLRAVHKDMYKKCSVF